MAERRSVQRFPHLVHCHISAYGHDGELRDRPGFDALVAARMGLMVEQAGHREGPIFLGHPSIDYVTGFLAVIGVLSALHARVQTGRGQFVDTSLFDGALSVSSMNWWFNEHDKSYLAKGDEEGFGRNRLITDLFQCGDGEYLMVHTGGEGGFKRTMDLLGFSDIVRDVGGVEMSTPLNDEEYHAARHLAPETFRTRSRDEWIKLFHAADLAALPVLRPEEVFADDQVVHADIVVDVDDPVVGPLRQIGPVVRFRDSPAPATAPAPIVGADDDRLGDLLASPVRTASAPTRSLGSPLEGLRILDLSAFFATAFGARLLSDLGADVIKIEPLVGDQMRPLADLFECAQRGKRNLAIDLRTTEGVDVVRKLHRDRRRDHAQPATRQGREARHRLRAVRGDQPVADLLLPPGFGSTGPKANLKSFAPLVSGFTGMLYVGAGDGNPPVRRVVGNEDLYNGYLGAMSVLMGVAHRDRTGHSQYIESPHLHSSLMLRTEQCTDAEGRARAGAAPRHRPNRLGSAVRLYRTSRRLDRHHLRRSTSVRTSGRRPRAPGSHRRPPIRRRDHAGGPRRRPRPELIARFSELSSDEAFAALDRAQVPCEIPLEVPYMDDFLWDQWAEDSGRVFAHDHPEHGYVREVGNCLRLSATPALNKGPSARLGQHTREVLDELGYSPADIDRLLGVVCKEPS